MISGSYVCAVNEDDDEGEREFCKKNPALMRILQNRSRINKKSNNIIDNSNGSVCAVNEDDGEGELCEKKQQ